MARTGRPTKPTEQKRAAGNPGKRPLPEPSVAVPQLASPPPAPEGLQTAGLIAWGRIWTLAITWLARSDVVFVELVCSAVDERARLLRTVEAEGVTFVTEKGYMGVHPALSELRKLDGQLTTWLGLLGLTPADRSRLGFAEVKRASKLAQLRERMAAQVGDGGDGGGAAP